MKTRTNVSEYCSEEEILNKGKTAHSYVFKIDKGTVK